MIEHEQLLGYALNALDPAEQAEITRQLASDTAAQMDLERIRKVLAPLAVLAEEPAPPVNLVENTLAKLDASLNAPKPSVGARRQWLEMALAASIGLLGFGLIVTGLTKWQADQARIACQNNLRTIAVGLDQYASQNQDRYPRVGCDTAKRAGDFHKVLEEARVWDPNQVKTCDGVKPVGYAYSLGYRNGAGQHFGPMREAAMNPYLPIVADFPMKGVTHNGPFSPHLRGSNVLFQDGHVIFTTVPSIGHQGDHIYLNRDGHPKAGTHPHDTVLGCPDDVP